MRSRNIKPGFFANEYLAELPPLTRLLFAGLWCLADREGRMEDRPKRIKAEVLPYDNADVDDMLNGLGRAGFVIRYAVGDKCFIQITNFSKHQRPHANESPSEIPKMDEVLSAKVESTCGYGDKRLQPRREALRSDSLIPDSGFSDSLIPDTGYQEIPAPRVSRSARSRKTPIPDGFSISERVRRWAEEKGFVNLECHLEHFIGCAKAKGYQYIDWDEAFMNAIRGDWAGLRVIGGRARESPEERRNRENARGAKLLGIELPGVGKTIEGEIVRAG